MLRQISLPLLSIVLVAGLLFPPTAPYIAVYPEIAALILGAILFGRRQFDILGVLPFRILWIGLLALVVTLPFVMRGVGDLMVFVFLLPVLVGPAVPMLMAEEPRFSDPTVIGALCLSGALGALGIASYEVFIEGVSRVQLVNNPIHFGALSLVLGNLTLVGLFGSRSQWRFLFLLGPLFGAGGTVLAATSGPMLALAVTTLVTVPLLIAWFWREPGFRIAVVLVAIGGIVGVQALSPKLLAKGVDNFGDVASLVTGHGDVGNSTQERVVTYSAAFQAFLASPIVGYGSGQLSSAPNQYMPEAYARLRDSEQMLSDVADFAVIGGVFGVFAYVCILLAPLLAWRLSDDQETRRMLFLGGLVLSVSYFTLGLTNAVLGILPQTALFGLALGILVGLGRNSPRGSRAF